MSKIKIRQFKGLIAYGDVSDNTLEYSTEFKNIFVEPGYIKSLSYNLSNFPFSFNNEQIVRVKVIYLDEDIYKDRLDDNWNLINDYTPDIKKYLLVITKKDNKYYIYIDNEKIDFEYLSENEENIHIYNDNKVVKIFFKESSFVLKRYYRHYFDGTGIKVFQGIKVMPLIYLLKEDNPSIGNFRVVTDFNNEPPIDAEVTFVGEGIYEIAGIAYKSRSYEVKVDSQKIYYPGNNGYLNVFKGYYLDEYNVIRYVNVIYHEPHRRIIHNFDELFGNIVHYTFIIPAGGGEAVPAINLGTFSEIEIFPSNIKLNPVYASLISDDFMFLSSEQITIATTVETDQGEFLYQVEEISRPQVSRFAIKLNNINYAVLSKDIIAVHFYLESRSVITENDVSVTDIKDFELLHTINLRKSIYYNPIKNYPYFGKISTNGIKLFQRIGTNYTKDYTILTNFSHYIVINGIGFAISRGKIYYNAVGNGKQLINNFYPQNIIPHINGQLLIKIGNNLGLVDSLNNKILVLDYQPIETSLIFYVKDELENVPKDIYDIVETSGGTFINTKEGIILSDGYRKTYVAQQIRDILRQEYNKTKLLFDSYNSILFIITNDRIYGYNLLTTAITEYTIRIDDIKDFTADNNGNVYFLVVSDGRTLIKTFTENSNVYGIVGYKNADLQETSLKKKIKGLIFDCEGEVIFDNKSYFTDERKFIDIPIRYDKRQYKDFIEFNFKFKGKIYSIELDIEAISFIKY